MDYPSRQNVDERNHGLTTDRGERKCHFSFRCRFDSKGNGVRFVASGHFVNIQIGNQRDVICQNVKDALVVHTVDNLGLREAECDFI